MKLVDSSASVLTASNHSATPASSLRGLFRVVLSTLLFSAVVARASYTLNWDDNSDDETGFTIQRAVYDPVGQTWSAFTTLNTVGTNVTTYQDTTADGTSSYEYRVFASNAIGNSANSNVATNAPTFTAQPASTQTAPTFGNITFTATAADATGGPAITYQWQKNGTPLSDGATGSGSTITGSATNSLTITNLQATDGLGAVYAVVAANGFAPAATSSGTALTLTKAVQTITFGALTPVTYAPGLTVNLGATTNSPLTIGYTSGNTSVATVSGNVLTVRGTGNATITASQGGDPTYLAAPNVTQNLTVVPSAQTITFGALTPVTYSPGLTVTLTGTASSNLAVTYTSSNLGVATVSGTTVTILSAGNTTITANQAGNSNYNAATAVPQTLTINKANQTITFNALPTFVAGQAPYTLTATATSGLAVNFASSNFNVAATGGSTGATLTIGSSGGTGNITATQPGNTNYNAAAAVVQPFSVNKAPAFTTPTQAVTNTIVAGNGITLATVSNAIPAATFQWQVSFNAGTSWQTLADGANYSGSLTATLTITAAPASFNGNEYRCVATNSVASVASSAFTLVVQSAPSFTTQPTNTVTQTGSNASFTVAVTGNPAPALQWQVSTNGGSTFGNLANNATYSGVTTATLSITAATTTLNGYVYRCVASNTTNVSNVVNSNSAVLTVGNVAPAITSNPSSQSVSAGTNATLTVAASGGPAPTFQWQVSVASGPFTNLANDSTYSGVTTTTLTITAAGTALSGNKYQAVATNTAGSATSTAATLTVTTTPPTFSTQPANTSAVAGNPASFTAVASGNPAPTLLWQISTDNGTTWNPLTIATPYSVNGSNPSAGTTSSTLSISDVTGLNANQYRAVATNAGGSANSNAATLSVVTNLPPVFTTQPANQTVTLGNNVSFGVAVTGTPTPTLQWQVSTDSGTTWNNVVASSTYAGVTTTTLLISNPPTSFNAYQYRCVATNVAAVVNSNAATLAVVTVPPTITLQPVNQTTYVGSSTTFAVNATGNPTPVFQWEISTDGGTTWNALANDATYSGTTTSILTISNATLALSNNQYRALASNAGGATPSAGATLTVSTVPPPPVLPVFLDQPASATVPVGGRISLSVYATGSPSPTYQWRFKGTPIDGAVGTDFLKTNVQPSDAGTYDCVATNSAGSTPSAGAVITVNFAPSITTQPSGATVIAGGNVTFSVAATGTAPLSYQWQKAGINLSGATGTSLALSNVQLTDAGSYDVVVSNSLGSATSNPALLAVNSSNFAGDYFGTLSGGGTWALHIHNDNTGTYLAFLPDRHTAIVVSVTVSANGTFSVNGTEIGSTSVAFGTGGIVPRLVATASPFTLSGSIAAGQVSGQLTGIGESLSGTSDSGTNANAGFYKAVALGTSGGTTYSIVGPSGHALVVTTTATTIDAVSGTLNGSNQLTGTTSSGAQVSVTLNPQNQSVSASYTTSGGTTTNFGGVADTATVTTRLTNLSARAVASSGDSTLIAGFIVTGSSSKSLLIRGVGPTLANYGVTGMLDDPMLGVYLGTNAVATNDDWGSAANASAVQTTSVSVGAFALPSGSKDAALLTSLTPGLYTAQVSGKGNSSGVALIELYDAATTTDSRLVNVSARTQVGTGGNVLIVGFTVAGNAPKQYLIRAVGPSLTNFNVAGVLADPQLSVTVQGSSTVVAQNNDWGGTTTLKSAFVAAGAFALPDSSADAAVLVTLQPGAYSAVVSGVNNTTGVALIELYEMP